MNTKYFAIVTIISASIIIGTTVITADRAFATKYGKNQATSQANACGNGDLSMYISCQNFNSQYQGKKNAVAIDGQQQQGEQGH